MAALPRLLFDAPKLVLSLAAPTNPSASTGQGAGFLPTAPPRSLTLRAESDPYRSLGTGNRAANDGDRNRGGKAMDPCTARREADLESDVSDPPTYQGPETPGTSYVVATAARDDPVCFAFIARPRLLEPYCRDALRRHSSCVELLDHAITLRVPTSAAQNPDHRPAEGPRFQLHVLRMDPPGHTAYGARWGPIVGAVSSANFDEPLIRKRTPTCGTHCRATRPYRILGRARLDRPDHIM